MTILGIDPGTATTGFGVIEKKTSGIKCVTYGCVITPKTQKAGQRLLLLEKGILQILASHKPDILAIERLFFFKNLKSALPVSEARGVVLLCAAKKKLPIVEFAPLQAKMAITGYGRADKKQMQAMVQKLLNLPSIPKPDDAADALALAIACAVRA
ncbi:MAG: crossover junction endodeoxyribonuclease RuvC [Candidatus Wildermuthbacteria bacterium RIFCSPHIGHO2_01_FULL_48_25]|uniref:Crossover junction endodeoxyribonuclease RuvC n=1 Tax=Candidatus Wildermuthbacteria bacterium RIFCSPLOWO2_01_FULL_48_16 TaxID=1802461 RepID=A0A1G2RJR1_9BACT|nr:MAG: crossover junction endodeoxyribonuclease RuvC [Candidatus Wildermuthbacteria bacterium RIFCSPHIGHO2_01_FULL_48_25]OHA68258.1 MAG: crossover junction endodeoxyribonuclease RuvC [Candidatus Wildermuthbacteria bacterium RIFCSPHIGHO2_02_FULL_49_12b]OHA73076.1 MAG: crossover junction endodeoxyribonuclease RuvC [Candidatus Wildermuthbacteria bacterium RIFCSPLOWO2_01_FULL_48_16]